MRLKNSSLPSLICRIKPSTRIGSNSGIDAAYHKKSSVCNPDFARRLLADVFVPEGGFFPDKLLHHGDALVQVKVDHVHALGAQEGFGAGEGARLADDDFGNAELHDRARAQVA